MIIEYHRPESLTEALELIARQAPLTVPLGGGTVLSRRQQSDCAVVDLQNLGLNQFHLDGQLLTVGAAVTLQQLFENQEVPAAMRSALRDSLLHEAALHVRQAATLAGTLVSCDGRSPFVTAMLALDPRLVWEPGEEAQPLGDYLPLREPPNRARLITGMRLPLNAALSFAMVARSPMDRPLVCAAVATWPSGRTRVALGGFGKAPMLAMDGPEAGGAATAAREAYRFAADEWASAQYRMETAGKLVQRLLVEQAAARS